jgi:NAD(P)-dependent dehydrogenase (short-subunit alcohol dehydrogenase family)
MNSFKNKNVVITGGSSGLGRALALQLLEKGAKVAIVARSPEPLKALKQEYPALLTFQADVSDKHAIHPLAAAIQSQLGDVDLLINGASSLGPTPLRYLVDTECEDLEAVLQTNLIGPFRLTKALLPGMLLKQAGQAKLVVNISSDAAISAYPTWGSYSVSKAALDHLSRIFDAELQAQGVRFLAIDPGDMDTPLHRAAVPDANPAELRDPADSARALIALIEAQDFASNADAVRRSL